MALQFIGIILVVIGHSGGVNFFPEWFPYYSFHLPLFIFISGYFFVKNTSLQCFFAKKVKSLLIPYFMWNLVYSILSTAIRKVGIISYGSNISLKSLFITPWITGGQTGLNVASWFALSLVIVSIVYFLFKQIFKHIHINNEYVITFIFLLIALLGIKMAVEGNNQDLYIPLTRTMFYLLFYQLGVLYKEKLESKDKLNSYLYFSIIFTLQFAIIYKYNNIEFTNYNMVFFANSIFLPVIVSITGIAFWLRVAKIISPLVKESKITKYIGSNTWTVMMHHQLVFFLLNLSIYILSPHVNIFRGFDPVDFKINCWYSYVPANMAQFKFFYVILGISIPLIFKYFVTKRENNKS